MKSAISITGLSYSYPDGPRALEEIDLEVRSGERVGLIGPSGAGKSTLVLHLNGILTGTGLVRILGCSTEGADLREVRRHVGLVFQNPDDQLFCPTVFDDIAFGPLNLSVSKNDIPQQVERALNDVGLDHSFLKRSSHHLSHGERKRVALASVLIMQPQILVLDEPTSNLDPRNRRQLIDLISRLPATLLLATHDLEMVLALCSRCVVMDRGRIIAGGDPRELLVDGELMEQHGLEIPVSLRRP